MKWHPGKLNKIRFGNAKRISCGSRGVQTAACGPAASPLTRPGFQPGFRCDCHTTAAGMSSDWILDISISNINCSYRISRQLCAVIQLVMLDTIIHQVFALLPEKTVQPGVNTKSSGLIEARAENVWKSSLQSTAECLSGCFREVKWGQEKDRMDRGLLQQWWGMMRKKVSGWFRHENRQIPSLQLNVCQPYCPAAWCRGASQTLVLPRFESCSWNLHTSEIPGAQRWPTSELRPSRQSSDLKSKLTLQIFVKGFFIFF